MALFSFFRASQARTRPQRLSPRGGHIGIVGFHDRGFVIARPASIFSPWLKSRSQSLHGRISGNSTNIASGLQTAVRLLEKAPRSIKKRIFLCTDGYANRDQGAIAGIVRKAAEQSVRIDTLGFGDNYDAALLRQISQATSGRTYTVHGLRDITRALLTGKRDRATSLNDREASIVCVDLSGSMLSPMAGRQKIALVEEAILHLLHYRQSLFS